MFFKQGSAMTTGRRRIDTVTSSPPIHTHLNITTPPELELPVWESAGAVPGSGINAGAFVGSPENLELGCEKRGAYHPR